MEAEYSDGGPEDGGDQEMEACGPGGDDGDGGEEEGGWRGRGGGGGGRGMFRGRGRGPPPGWMNGPPPGCPPPMRFRGRGYGPAGPPPRGRGGFFRGRGGPGGGPGPRFGGPNFEGNWGPMGPPPPMMGGPPPPFGPPGMMGPGGPMGPPPNLMNQFGGGPPNMPPPNMVGQGAPDVWVETKSDEGKSYYYHSRTRETTWTRPQESPTCKVITQAEMEAMASSGQVPPGMPAGMMGGPPMGMPGMMGPGPMGMMPPNMGQQNNGQGMPFMGQPPWLGGKPDGDDGNQPNFPPFMQPPAGYNPNGLGKESPNNMSSQDSGSGGEAGDDNPPGDGPMPNGPVGFPNPGIPPPGYCAPWNPAGVPWGGPPPSWPPPMLPPVSQPPPNVAAALTGVPPVLGSAVLTATESAPTAEPAPAKVAAVPVAAPVQEDQEISLKVPTELATRAAEWSTHRAPDGRAYYYCAKRQESVWEKPPALKELDEFNMKIAKSMMKTSIDVDPTPIQQHVEVIDVEAHEEAKLERIAAEHRAAEERERERLESERLEKERLEKERIEKERLEKERMEKEKVAKAADKSKPISSTPISGTPWCVVWTGDGRVFFYNPTTHSSVWERPEQLINRSDVDNAVSSPPEVLVEQAKKDAANALKQLEAEAAAQTTNGGVKRPGVDSDSDSEPEQKKSKTEEAVKKADTGNTTVINAGHDAAIEAEVRAARERAVVPLELRIKSFRQMLQEKEVSAFSTWEKELHKIVFDSRYLVLNSKERKQVFDKYVRERAEEERKEKRNRLKQKKDAFRALLEECKLHAKSSFTDFASKYAKEDRFRGIEKMRERESLFNEYIVEVRKKEKEEKAAKREQAKKDFLALLKEKEVDRHMRWSDVRKKIDSEARYKAVDGSSMREDIFREYCKLTKEEKKKDSKDRDRSSSKKDKKDKDRDKDKDKDKDRKEKKDKKEKEKEKEKGSDAEDKNGEAEAGGDADEAGDAATADVDEELAVRERAARAEASIKEREKEVQRALANSLRDRDKEREYHKRDEAIQHFNALLADLVRNPDLSWRDARKQLKKDNRYELSELLSKDDKERLFTTHTANLAAKRRIKFRELLAELGVSLTSHWRDVRKRAKDDPRCTKYASADKCEREFRDYQRDRLSSAKNALRELLQEARTLTHKSLLAVKENPAHMATLQEGLKHDARFLVLDHVPEERDQIIMSYLEDLEKKGPPPPPTASEPSRRINK